MYSNNFIYIDRKENLFLDIIVYCISKTTLNSKEVSFLKDLFLKIKLKRIQYLTIKQISWLWNIANALGYNPLILREDVTGFIKNVSE